MYTNNPHVSVDCGKKHAIYEAARQQALEMSETELNATFTAVWEVYSSNQQRLHDHMERVWLESCFRNQPDEAALNDKESDLKNDVAWYVSQLQKHLNEKEDGYPDLIQKLASDVAEKIRQYKAFRKARRSYEVVGTI